MTINDTSPTGIQAYLSLFKRNRDFRLLYSSQIISLAGDWFLTVPLLDLVYRMTHSSTAVALMVVSQTLPIFIFTPWAGATIDRSDRKRLMIVMDIARIGAALLPLLARTPSTLPIAFVGVIAISIGAAYFDPASNAALPNIVEPRDLGIANVLMGSTWGTMLAVGAAAGGIVAGKFGSDVAFIIDAASFLLSALLLKAIRAPFSESRPHADRVPLSEAMRQTFRYARNHSRVLALLLAKGGFGVGGGVIVMLTLFGTKLMGDGATGVGFLYAMRGVGALVGPFLVRGLIKADNHQYRSIGICGILFGLGYCGLAVSPTLAIGGIAVLMAHLGAGAQWITSTYGLQKETPDYIRGRVFAVDYGLITLTMSASSLLAGFIADKIGPSKTTICAAAISTLWGLVWTISTYKLWREKENAAVSRQPSP